VEQLLRTGPPPEAIFATNDFAAIGAIGALRERGLRVPQDIGIVGYNDTPLAESLPVPLTTVRSPMVQIGRSAFLLLSQVLSGERPEAIVLPPKLVARESAVAR